MKQVSYRPTRSDSLLSNPLLQAVTQGLAELMPITACESWPQPLLELLARLESPDNSDETMTPSVVIAGRCPTITEQAATLLRASELDVISCKSGEEVVAAMKRRAGDVALVVSDQHLDGPMDGYDLIQALGLLWPGVPIILTTDRPNREPLPIAATELEKPWPPLALLVEAHRALAAPPPMVH